MSNPNKRERLLAVNHYYKNWVEAVDEWIDTGLTPASVDDDVVDLAKLLAEYREELTNGR